MNPAQRPPKKPSLKINDWAKFIPFHWMKSVLFHTVMRMEQSWTLRYLSNAGTPEHGADPRPARAASAHTAGPCGAAPGIRSLHASAYGVHSALVHIVVAFQQEQDFTPAQNSNPYNASQTEAVFCSSQFCLKNRVQCWRFFTWSIDCSLLFVHLFLPYMYQFTRNSTCQGMSSVLRVPAQN